MASDPSSRMGAQRNELLSDLVGLAERVFVELEVSPAQASIVANALADRLADHWGGQNINFPKDYRWKLARVELEILDAFKGDNIPELARKYKMTERGIRMLIRRVRARITAANQAGLFDLPEPSDAA